jgi:hypothetical protein
MPRARRFLIALYAVSAPFRAMPGVVALDPSDFDNDTVATPAIRIRNGLK